MAVKLSKQTLESFKELRASIINEKGQEVPDPRPIVLDVSPPPKSLQDRIKEIVATQISLDAAGQGMESLEEANDFDIDDSFEYEPKSGYELIDEEFLETVPEVPPDQATKNENPPPATGRGEDSDVANQDAEAS